MAEEAKEVIVEDDEILVYEGGHCDEDRKDDNYNPELKEERRVKIASSVKTIEKHAFRGIKFWNLWTSEMQKILKSLKKVHSKDANRWLTFVAFHLAIELRLDHMHFLVAL